MRPQVVHHPAPTKHKDQGSAPSTCLQYSLTTALAPHSHCSLLPPTSAHHRRRCRRRFCIIPHKHRRVYCLQRLPASLSHQRTPASHLRFCPQVSMRHENAKTQNTARVRNASPSRLQRRAVLSREAVAMVFPSGEKATLLTASVCPWWHEGHPTRHGPCPTCTLHGLDQMWAHPSGPYGAHGTRHRATAIPLPATLAWSIHTLQGVQRCTPTGPRVTTTCMRCPGCHWMWLGIVGWLGISGCCCMSSTVIEFHWVPNVVGCQWMLSDLVGTRMLIPPLAERPWAGTQHRLKAKC